MRPALIALALAALVLGGTAGAAGSAGSGPVRIAFVSNRSGASNDLWVMNADGTNQHRVTNTPGYGEQESTWAPDGLRIAFQTDPEANVDRGDAIAVMGRSGGIKLITTGSAPNGNYQDDREPDWAPDGSRIAFARSTGSGYRIWTTRPNGTGAVQVTNGGFDRAPTWSPDSRRIAFVRSGELWIVNADGTAATRVAGGYLSNPAWSRTDRRSRSRGQAAARAQATSTRSPRRAARSGS